MVPNHSETDFSMTQNSSDSLSGIFARVVRNFLKFIFLLLIKLYHLFIFVSSGAETMDVHETSLRRSRDILRLRAN